MTSDDEDEDEMDDKVVMNNDDEEVEVEQSLVEDVDVNTYEMDKQIEVEV